MWRKGNEVLSAGPLLLSRDDRFHLHESDFRLELRDITPSDAGDFTCQISIASRETIELSHTVEVLGESISGTSVAGELKGTMP